MDFRIETERLVIRPLILTDYEAWKESHLSRPTAGNEYDKPGLTIDKLNLAEFEKRLSEAASNREKDLAYDYALFSKMQQKFLGSVILMRVHREIAHNCYLGYSVSPLFWGQGFGKEAVNAVIDFAFRHLKLHRVEAAIQLNNERSMRLARGVGMRHEGVRLRGLFLDNAWEDMNIYAVTSEERGIQHPGSCRAELD